MTASTFYKQHHDLDAPVISEHEFRPFYRVRARLDQLLFDKAITLHEWRAAQVFRSMAERVIALNWPATDWGSGGGTGGGLNRNLAARQDAVNRLHTIHQRLGGLAIDILEAHIVDDATWTTLGARYGVHPRTARRWTVIVVKGLATVIWA